jgi:hypothetical protein
MRYVDSLKDAVSVAMEHGSAQHRAFIIDVIFFLMVTLLLKRSNFFPPCGSTAQFWALAASIKLFRSISVTKSRTDSRTPWTGDQLVATPLRVCPG